MTVIYLISAKWPWTKIKVVEAEILQGKWTWERYRDHRHLVGATAFYTLPAAKRAQVGYLTKIVKDKYFQRFYHDKVKMCKAIIGELTCTNSSYQPRSSGSTMAKNSR